MYDPVVQAVSGLASLQADANGRPQMMRLIIPDKLTALTASQAITAALLQRVRTGVGQHVKLSMLDTVQTRPDSLMQSLIAVARIVATLNVRCGGGLFSLGGRHGEPHHA